MLRQVVSRSDCGRECRGTYRRSTERLWLRDEVRLLLGVALRDSTLSMLEIAGEDGEFIAAGSTFIGYSMSLPGSPIWKDKKRCISERKKESTRTWNARGTAAAVEQWGPVVLVAYSTLRKP